jgi:hypothetical protein
MSGEIVIEAMKFLVAIKIIRTFPKTGTACFILSFHFWTPKHVSPLKTEFQLTGTVIEPTKTAFLRLT